MKIFILSLILRKEYVYHLKLKMLSHNHYSDYKIALYVLMFKKSIFN